MGSTEPVTFYDQHPFGWVTPDVSEPTEKVVSRPLISLTGNLEAGSLVLDPGCGLVRVLGVVLYGEDRGGNIHSFCLEKGSASDLQGDSSASSKTEPLIPARGSVR